LLSSARRPAIIAGESVHWHDAAAELAALAAALDAPVYAAPNTGMLPVDASRPCYAGYLPPSFQAIGERLTRHDLLLYAGARGFRTTLFNGGRLPQRKAWLGDDAAMPGESGEFEIARVAALKTAWRTSRRHRRRQPAPPITSRTPAAAGVTRRLHPRAPFMRCSNATAAPRWWTNPGCPPRT
jgi:benzoylformate decarboxylase